MNTGRCHCGDIVYQVPDPIAVVYCHCESCRRSAGAPILAWAMYPAPDLKLEQGTPAIYASTPGVERHFCSRCGTSLFFYANYLPGLVDVTVASHDEPETLPPAMHIWEAKRLPWLQLADGLPRHEAFPPFE